MGKRLFFVAAAFALLFLQAGDCMAAMDMDQASMQCCQSMTCAPTHHSEQCCKPAVSSQAPNILPAQHFSLRAPIAATVQYPRLTEIFGPSPSRSFIVEAQQHSPPELYTLHSSFLI